MTYGSQRCRHLCALILGLLILNLPSAVRAADEERGHSLNTPHFILYVERLDPDETSRLMEAAYGEMQRFFAGVEPDRKLQVKIYATREGYLNELERLRRIFGSRRKWKDLAGVYMRETACAYLYIQPDESRTRHVLLHELGHQYHDFVRPWTKLPSLEFCEEGIAEYFAQHNWDGKVLRLGVAPVIGQPDYPRAALQTLKNTARFDLQSIVDGDTEVDYPLAWGLVSFLIERHRPQFDIWRQGINNDVEPRLVWQKQFGPVTPEFSHSFQTWLESNAPPWQVVSGEWFPSGNAIAGRTRADQFAVAILNETPRELNLALTATNGTAGVVFGFRGTKNFHVVQHLPDGRWELMHYEGGVFQRGEARTFPAANAQSNISIAPEETSTRLKFADQSILLMNAIGRVGLWIKDGNASFSNPNTDQPATVPANIWPSLPTNESHPH